MLRVLKQPAVAAFLVTMLIGWMPLLAVRSADESVVDGWIGILICSMAIATITYFTKSKLLFLFVLALFTQGAIFVFTKWTALEIGYFFGSFLFACVILWKSRFFETRWIGEWKAPDASN